MQPQKARKETVETDRPQRPTIALVQHGELVGLFAADQAEAADRATTRLISASGRHVDVYEIDQRLPDPPALGTSVDPHQLGWVNVG